MGVIKWSKLTYPVEDIAEEWDNLRKQVQDWYKTEFPSDCGVIARYKEKHNVPFSPKNVITKMINNTLQDETLCQLIINLIYGMLPYHTL